MARSQPAWQLLCHTYFLKQIEKLMARAQTVRRADPSAWQADPNARCLAALHTLTHRAIPADPLSRRWSLEAWPERLYRQIGGHGHWGRAEFGGGRFALFYHVQPTSRSIVYVWVADRRAQRTCRMEEPHVLLGHASAMTASGRVLVPLAIRQALDLGEGDRISYRLAADAFVMEAMPRCPPHEPIPERRTRPPARDFPSIMAAHPAAVARPEL